VANAILSLRFLAENLVTLNLLLDLDGTLLGNEINGFVSGYTAALAKFMASYVEPGYFVQSLMKATGAMIQGQRPECTLEQNFDAVFYPALGYAKEDLRPQIDTFYREIFPSLQPLTEFRPEAVQFVEEALRRGHRLSIATNPLFPRTAILQRLAWAGFPAGNLPFEIVPSFETFHFAKPNPAFFAEILAYLGWPDGPVVMVGNEMSLDISPARMLGLSAFWIDGDGAASSVDSRDPLAPQAFGKIQDIISWLDVTQPEALKPGYNTPAAYIAILEATLAFWDTMVRCLPAGVYGQRPNDGEWCLSEIICHLRDVDADVNLPRLQKIILENNPFLPGKDTDPWAEERHYINQDCMQAAGAFMAARQNLVTLLRSLKPEEWKRPARHAIFGPTDLSELVGFITGHDRLHIQQALQAVHRVAPGLSLV